MQHFDMFTAQFISIRMLNELRASCHRIFTNTFETPLAIRSFTARNRKSSSRQSIVCTYYYDPANRMSSFKRMADIFGRALYFSHLAILKIGAVGLGRFDPSF